MKGRGFGGGGTTDEIKDEKEEFEAEITLLCRSRRGTPEISRLPLFKGPA